ncbi:uncharacterized protein EV420DRAFT_933110 [Desarmillaria tabescens]|uniref:Uncharacterized protein n=1 Tax=Armillaria tabescens TaxID=1929756 RepID=A0AA39NG44_ARMTA|nr:uncharacterized protein EV420DRAFT_933110 [Desarmillaria tabescens]KAK0465003.1 hypothetical protein EV420DRAFT_933110 [Desarmillaria tabescens]
MSAHGMDFTAYADEVNIPTDALLIPSAQLAPWCSSNLCSSFDSSSTQQTSSHDPYDVPPRAPSPEPPIHPLKPRPRSRSRADEAFIKDAEAHSDLVPGAPPPSPAAPHGPDVGRLQELTSRMPPNLIPLPEFGIYHAQSPIAMEESSHSDEEPMLCVADRSQLWTHVGSTEQTNTQLVREKLSDDAMETSSEGNVSYDCMDSTSPVNLGQLSDYLMRTSED